jgi:hypothetical protein
MEREPSSLRWDSNVRLFVLRDFEQWQIALQIEDESSRQRGCPKTKGNAIFWQKKGKKGNLVMGPKGVSDTKTDRPTDRWSQHQLNPKEKTIIARDKRKRFCRALMCLPNITRSAWRDTSLSGLRSFIFSSHEQTCFSVCEFHPHTEATIHPHFFLFFVFLSSSCSPDLSAFGQLHRFFFSVE